MKLPILAAIILAGSLAHAGSIVQKPLDEFLIYDIPVVSKTGTTTVMFPSEISGLFAKSVAVQDQENAGFLISFTPGNFYFTIRALKKDAEDHLTVIFNRKAYVLHLIASENPFYNVTFYQEERNGKDGRIPVLLLGLLSGCATPKTLKTENYPAVAGTSIPERNLERVRAPEVVKSYPTGRYSDPNFPDAMHKRHTLYRKEQSADWNYRPGGPYAYPLVVSDPTPSYYVKTDGDQRNAQQKAYAAALEEQNVAMKKRIESLQQEAGKVPALQQQIDKLKQQLEAEPLQTPAPKNQPVEEKPAGFTLEDPQRNLIAEMKLNHELSGELDALEGGRLVLMEKNFLNTITP